MFCLFVCLFVCLCVCVCVLGGVKPKLQKMEVVSEAQACEASKTPGHGLPRLLEDGWTWTEGCKTANSRSIFSVSSKTVLDASLNVQNNLLNVQNELMDSKSALLNGERCNGLEASTSAIIQRSSLNRSRRNPPYYAGGCLRVNSIQT